MSATIIDGKAVASQVLEECKVRVDALKARGVNPCLAVIRVGDDPASVVYVNGKMADCAKVGMLSRLIHLPETTTQNELLSAIYACNADRAIHGLLVQLPLPQHLGEQAVIHAIDPRKDADGFHPHNAAALYQGDDLSKRAVACTPAGVMRLIANTGVSIVGKKAVVIGRSNIVGKPMAQLLLAGNATVTMCHSRTENLADEVRLADIVVAAVGKCEMVKGEWIKKGAIVIDVGMNKNAEGKLVGDVAFSHAVNQAGFITPVPGGVGPMTRAMLLANTLTLVEASM